MIKIMNDRYLLVSVVVSHYTHSIRTVMDCVASTPKQQWYSSEERHNVSNNFLERCHRLSSALNVDHCVLRGYAERVVDMFEREPTYTQLCNIMSFTLAGDGRKDYVALANRLKIHELFRRTTSSFERSLSQQKALDTVPELSAVERMYLDNKREVDRLIKEYTRHNYNLSYHYTRHLFAQRLGKSADGTVVERPVHLFMRTSLGRHTQLDDVKKTFIDLSLQRILL